MKFSFILILFNMFIFLKACHSQMQAISLSHESRGEKNPDMTPENLKSIFEIAKNISNSRGELLEPENRSAGYRRSYMKKLVLEAKSDALRTSILIAKKSDDDLLEALNNIEYLVHQFDVALDFVRIGGVQLVLPLTQHQDSKIASLAFSILTAAMQGNQAVQGYVGKEKILDYITDALTRHSKIVHISVLYTLSSYLRNSFEAQLQFYNSGGLAILANTFKSKSETLKAKLKIIDLLSDLASEINAESENKSVEAMGKLLWKGMQDSKLCDGIPSFLNIDDYLVREKVLNSMLSLFTVCSDEFSQTYIVDTIRELQRAYDPNTVKYWYSKHDPEMLWLMSEKLMLLLEEISKWRFKKKIDL